MRARLFWALFFCVIPFTICACTTVEARKNATNKIINEAGFSTKILQTSPYKLFSADKHLGSMEDKMTIVIEGDGYAWVNRYTLSDNPTPTNPIGLKIASSIEKPTIYLARPCQYISDDNCTPAMWSYNRFNNAVMDSYINALDIIKQQYGVKEFDVIGFSGGAYIALFLAVNRNDIKSVTTIAGVLDPDDWTNYHDISPLNIQHDITSLVSKSQNTDFIHICSHDDEIVPCQLTRMFLNNLNSQNTKNHQIIEHNNKTHEKLWEMYPQRT